MPFVDDYAVGAGFSTENIDFLLAMLENSSCAFQGIFFWN